MVEEVPPLVAAPAVVVFGADGALLSAALSHAVDAAVGDADRSLAVEHAELSASAVAAASIAPMFASRRVIVFRAAHTAPPESLEALWRYLQDPVPSTTLVVEWAASKLPAAAKKVFAATSCATVDANAPRTASQRAGHVRERFARSAVSLDSSATARVLAVLGEDVGRLESVVSVLESRFEPGARLGPGDVEPYLGERGTVPVWDLTDAIDAGRTADALVVLSRLVEAGGRHPLAVLSSLRAHYDKAFKVDALGLADEKAAAAALGLKGSAFPARKAIALARRLGSGGVEQALGLIAPTASALKGGSGLPGRLVLEVLVARLSKL